MRQSQILLALIILIGCSGETSRIKEEKLATKHEKLLFLADSCYKTDQYRLAMEYFNQLIETDSVKGEYYYKRAFCKDQLLDYEGSSGDYLKSIELGYRPAESYYNLGLSQVMLANDSLAVFYFEKSLKMNPNDPKVLSALETYRKKLKKKTDAAL